VTRILHVSDLHLGIPLAQLPRGDLAPKRLLGAANLALRRGPRFADAHACVSALSDFVAEHAVDAVIVTGDYTALGTVPELEAARRIVAPLTARPLGFATVPGNHDVYVESGVRERRFERAFAGLLESDWPEYVADGPWPLVRWFGDAAAVVCVNSARPNPQLWRSSGYVPPLQIEALRRVLDDPRLAERFVFVATHYAPRRADGSPDRPWHGLVNADALLAAIGPRPRTVLVHGHLHDRFALAPSAAHPPVFGAGSATDAHHRTLWLYELDATGLRAIPGNWRAGRYELARDGSVRVRHDPSPAG
jgi:3',5'-cyclic AMP phosphodiesterase CpdA